MKTASIKRNYILNTAYQVLSLLTPLITAPYVSRVLGAEGVGVYSYTNSIMAIFSIFAVLGTTSYGQREIARCRDDKFALSKTFWEIAALSSITTLITTICWLIFVAFSAERYRLIYLILTLQLIGTGLNITWFYAGIEEFSIIVLRSLIVKIVSIVLLFLLVQTKDDLLIYIDILSISGFIGYVLMWLPIRKYISRVPLRKMRLRHHFKQTIAYFVPTIAASIYTYLDKTMIGVLTQNANENGYYEQSQKIVTMAYTLVASLNMVMSSRISYLLAKGSMNEIRARIESSFAFILTISIPLSFGIAGITNNFVLWFFGSGYEEVERLLIFRSCLVVFLSLHNFYADQCLLPSGQRVRSTKAVICGAVVNFVFNLILIPKSGASGAIIATIVSEIVICVIYGYMSIEYVNPRLYLKYLPKRLISASIMFCCITVLSGNIKGKILLTFIQIGVGAICYFVVLLLLRDKFTYEQFKRMCIVVAKKVKR